VGVLRDDVALLHFDRFGLELCELGSGLGRGHFPSRRTRPANPFRYFKTSPDVIRLAVMMYVRFPWSLRNVENADGDGLLRE
jgi:hypothetical protein